jgi:hypothetical protein
MAGRKPGTPKTGGRQKGTPNKTTVAAKEAIHQAFEQMGGIPALVKWANKNDDNAKAFYTQVWPKIVPLQVGGDPDSPHRIEIVSRVVHS